MNKLLRYTQGNDTRRAMNKSFQTRGTYYQPIGKKYRKKIMKEKVAPDGMEWRNWEGDKLEKDGTVKKS